MERDIRGMSLHFCINQKMVHILLPWLLSKLHLWRYLIDEAFGTAIAAKWQMHQDGLTLHLTKSSIPTTDATLEHSGSIENFPIIAKEGNITSTGGPSAPTFDTNDDNDGSVPDLLHPDDDSSVSTSGSDIDNQLDDDDI